MIQCSACGKPVGVGGGEPSLRHGQMIYHVRCAPQDVIETVAAEYQAILRKGVRYFVEKYSGSSNPESDLGGQFLALGGAVLEEQLRREARLPPGPSGSARA